MDSIMTLLSGTISWALLNMGNIYKNSVWIHELGRKYFDKKLPSGMVLFDDFEQISPLVCRVMGLNPSSHTLQGTNTYLVGNGKKRILIDTGEGLDGYVPALQKAMKKIGCEGIDYILITHRYVIYFSFFPFSMTCLNE